MDAGSSPPITSVTTSRRPCRNEEHSATGACRRFNMTVVNGLDIDEQKSGSPPEEAAPLVADGRADIPTGFVSQLFGRAATEDLDRYTASELAQLAMDAWDLLAKRTPDAPKIRCALRPRASR